MCVSMLIIIDQTFAPGKRMFVPGNRPNAAPIEINILWYALMSFFPVLITREVTQLWLSRAGYFRSIENIVEAVLVIIISLLLVWGDYCDHSSEKRYLGAVAIVLSWLLSITMLGRHPKSGHFNIFFTMFYKVY